MGSYHQKFIVIDRAYMGVHSGDLAHSDGDFYFEALKVFYGTGIATCFTKIFFSLLGNLDTRFRCMPVLNIHQSQCSENELCIVLGKVSHNTPYRSFSEYNFSPYFLGLIECINHATDSLFICCSNINYPPILDAIKRALERGIKCTIVMYYHMNDSKMNSVIGGMTNAQSLRYIQNPAASRFSNLKVYLSKDIQGKWATPETELIIHAKVVSIDNEITFMGSSNLDLQSAYYSREYDVIFEGSPETRIMEYLLKNRMIAEYTLPL